MAWRLSGRNQTPKVLTEASVDRAHRSAVETLDKAADASEGILEGEPGIALAPLCRARRPDMTARDAQRRCPSRMGREPARWQNRVEEGEAEGRQHRGGSKIAFDPLEDRAQPDQLARCMQVE